MKRYALQLSAILLFTLAGCSTQVTRPTDSTTPTPYVRAVRDYTINVTPHQQGSAHVKFDKDKLSSMLQRALTSNNLLAPDGSYDLRVTVTDIRVRSTFSAVMWGFMAGDDHLEGDIEIIRDGESVYEFTVRASYALGGLAGGQDGMRLDWLYEQFAENVAKELVALRDKDNAA